MQPLGIDPDCVQQSLQTFHPFGGIGISFQEMALTLKSAGDKNPVNAAFEGP